MAAAAAKAAVKGRVQCLVRRQSIHLSVPGPNDTEPLQDPISLAASTRSHPRRISQSLDKSLAWF